jgi:hypothetical protein
MRRIPVLGDLLAGAAAGCVCARCQPRQSPATEAPAALPVLTASHDALRSTGGNRGRTTFVATDTPPPDKPNTTKRHQGINFYARRPSGRYAR